jgi:hypothetical protein
MKNAFAKLALTASLMMVAQQSQAFILITDVLMGPAAQKHYGLKAGAILAQTALCPIYGLMLFLGDDSENALQQATATLVAQGYEQKEAQNVAILLANAGKLDAEQGEAKIELAELVEAAPKAAQAGLLSVLTSQQ